MKTVTLIGGVHDGRVAQVRDDQTKLIVPDYGTDCIYVLRRGRWVFDRAEPYRPKPKTSRPGRRQRTQQCRSA